MRKIILVLMFVFMLLSCSNDTPPKHLMTTGYIAYYKSQDFAYDELMFKTDNGILIPFYISPDVQCSIEGDNFKTYYKKHTHLYIKYIISNNILHNGEPDNIVVIKELKYGI